MCLAIMYMLEYICMYMYVNCTHYDYRRAGIFSVDKFSLNQQIRFFVSLNFVFTTLSNNRYHTCEFKT